jgi:RIO kinase 1
MPRLNILRDLDDDFEPISDHSYPSRKRKKRNDHALLGEIAQHTSLQTLGTEEAFNPSLGASRWEREWIFNFLGSLYDTGYILDVLRRIKGGKEANVYLCQAHPSMKMDLLAAKLYRPRMVRNLRNDIRYRANRMVLDEFGKVVHDGRMLHAVRKGTAYGKELSHTSWLQYEYKTLQLLYDAGLPVPEPVTSSENTILMEYIGDLDHPAPNLTETTLTRQQARQGFDTLINAIEVMLSLGKIHADLSAYNVLYWNGRPTIIDFPQAISPDENREAWDIFRRDVQRICDYFLRYGIHPNPYRLARSIWMKHRGDPETPAINETDETDG